MSELHRRLGAALSLMALLAFVSGAGLDTMSVIPAAAILLVAMVYTPGERLTRVLEPLWRAAALLLAARAGFFAFSDGTDPVLPMVDLLLLLLCAESMRARDASGDARHFALTFALLIASAAYRPGPLFGLVFVLYVVCGTLLLVVGHLNRQARALGMAPPPPRAPFLLRVAGLSGVVLLVSVFVFLFFPRVSQGWAARATPAIARAVVGFSDRVSIGEHGATIASNPEVVLRVEFPDGAPSNVTSLHWRGRSYNYFDGVAWSRQSRVEARPLEQGWPGPVLQQRVYARPLGDANVLFGVSPVISIVPLSRIRPFRTASGDHLYLGDADPVYRVTSKLARPSAEQLRTVRLDDVHPETRDGAVIRRHTQTAGVTPRMLALADSFAAASSTMYDHVRAVETWLRTEFAYTLELPATRREASLDHFIFERRAGHCEYFSTAMAILLRVSGIPTRNVNGFLGGEWNEFGSFLTITQNHAHSWVEVYFPEIGWVEFDPTPAGGTSGLAQQTGRFRPMQQFLAGLEHRWGKWILDYDVGAQTNLLERATAPFRNDAAAEPGSGSGVRRVWPWVVAAVLVAALLLSSRRFGFTRDPRRNSGTRTYLKLRAAYERVGFPAAARMPPLQFAAAVAQAPGGEHARRAVQLYVKARFGGGVLSDAEARELVDAVAQSRAQLRAVRRRR